MMLVIMREHQEQLLSPEQPFCSYHWTRESETKTYVAEQKRGCCLLSTAHTTVRSAVNYCYCHPGNLCPDRRGAVLGSGCYRLAIGRAIPLRHNMVQRLGAEQCLEQGSAAERLGVKPCFWGAMLQSSRHKHLQYCATY